MKEIEFNHLTKDYKNGRGVFDINFKINKGEVFGYIGTNGSGKTTTIRGAMGFIKPDEGEVIVRGLDAWKDSSEIKKFVSYIPGEIAFPDLNSGTQFLQNQSEFIDLKTQDNVEKITKRLQLDASANLKRMSKGMKQKTAIVTALMKDADILIFDEPTTGLDPLMRQEFLTMIREEKEKGKTIFMSSQSFEELEETCDRVALIIDGHIIDIADVNALKSSSLKNFKIEFTNKPDYQKFKTLKYKIVRDQEKYNQVTIQIDKKEISQLFKVLTKFEVKFINEVNFTLEKYFKEKLKALRKSNPIKIYDTHLTKKEKKEGKNV